MGKPLKHHLAELMLYKKFHFKCPCIVPLDFSGVIENYEISSHGEIIFHINSQGKIIKIGENHPNMTIESI